MHVPTTTEPMTTEPTHPDATNPPANTHEGVPGDPLADHYIPAMPVKGEIFDEGRTFADLGLRDSVMKGIEACEFKHPTVTQAMLMPPILAGKDIIGQAKTGTGKTAAFGLPLLNNLEKDTPFQALILAPTRELAIQITDEIESLGKFTPIRAMTLYGGQAVHIQAGKLQKGAQIIVGTPGRVMDMLERGLLHFKNIKAVVLDEVDRMLDIGFREDIRRILEQTPRERQTVLVSATISPEIEKLARRYQRDPEKVVVASGSLTVSMVRQFYLSVNQWDKKKLLLHLLRHEEPALTLVFCRLKRTVDELARGLTERGIDSHAIHGDMPQGKRNKTMQALRGGNLSVLICSDLAARGLDVEGVSHVINFDIPEDPEVYVHRIGRTARAGRGGVAWTFVTPEQGELLTKVENLINAEVPKLEYPDFKANPPPPGWRGEAPGGRREGGLQVVGGAEAPPPPPPKTNRFEQTLKPDMPVAEPGKVDPSKFPGGIVPTKMPPKRLIRGYKTGR
jgi:ATP-dependent RNA helicase DeaD